MKQSQTFTCWGKISHYTRGITSNKKIMRVESSVIEGGMLHSLESSFSAGSVCELGDGCNTSQYLVSELSSNINVY